jgi:DNA-binding transcriptional MerR regulator
MELHHLLTMMIASDGFTTKTATALAGVSRATLERWDRSGFLSPSVPAKRRGISREYSFRDIVAIRVASELKREGIPLQALRKVVAYLCARTGLSPTDALASTNLVTDGRDVYEVQGDVVSISTLRRPGQRMLLMVPLDELVRELQIKARALSAAA